MAAILVVLAVWTLASSPIVDVDRTVLFHSLGVFRIAFGILLWLRLKRLRPALGVLWPSRPERSWDHVVSLRRLIFVWQGAAIALAAGLGTPAAAVASYLIGLYVFSRSHFYSIEEILFQAMSFFLIWLDAGRSYSVDSALGWSLGSPVEPTLAVNLFWLALGLVMFSAGFEKLWSPIWRRGQGFNCFVALPHLLLPQFRFIRRWSGVGMCLSWMTVVAELALIVVGPSTPLRIATTLVLLAFSVGLFVIVDFSFIGQALGLWLGFFLLLDVSAWVLGTSQESSRALQLDTVLGMLVSAAIALVVIRMLDVPAGPLRRAAMRFARWTVGLAPVRVFTEVHLYGVYVYRILAERVSVGQRELVPAFAADGGPGPFQRWYPRVFHSFMYPVSDLCLTLCNGGREVAKKSPRFVIVRDFVTGAFGALAPDERTRWDRTVLYVRSIDLLEPIGRNPSFVMSEWEPILAFPVRDGSLAEPAWIGQPPAVQKSARQVWRGASVADAATTDGSDDRTGK